MKTYKKLIIFLVLVSIIGGIILSFYFGILGSYRLLDSRRLYDKKNEIIYEFTTAKDRFVFQWLGGYEAQAYKTERTSNKTLSKHSDYLIDTVEASDEEGTMFLNMKGKLRVDGFPVNLQKDPAYESRASYPVPVGEKGNIICTLVIEEETFDVQKKDAKGTWQKLTTYTTKTKLKDFIEPVYWSAEE